MQANNNKISQTTKMSPASLVLIGAICGLCLLSVAGSILAEAMSLSDQADGPRQIPSSSLGGAPALALVESPELTARVLESLLRSIIYSASAAELQATNSVAQKRGLDLGISRGFSGSQAGKHLMGLSAASFANGPGRR